MKKQSILSRLCCFFGTHYVITESGTEMGRNPFFDERETFTWTCTECGFLHDPLDIQKQEEERRMMIKELLEKNRMKQII